MNTGVVWSKQEEQAVIKAYKQSRVTPHEFALEYSLSNKGGRTQNAVYCHLSDMERRGLVELNEYGGGEARILFLDIETQFPIAYVNGAYTQFVNPDDIIKDFCVICWSANWLGSDSYMCNCMTPKEAIARKDKRILGGIYKLLDTADIVIGQNVKKFDIRKLNTRFILSGIDQPPSPYKVVDTLLELRKTFGFTSNKQGFIGDALGNDGKDEMHKEDWRKCDQGDPEALDKMQKYNIQDVMTLKQNYLSIRSWIPSHPNVTMYRDKHDGCFACGGELHEDKYYPTNKRSRTAMRCADCGAITIPKL